MKILIISHMYPSSFNSMSGIFVHKQALALKRQGCEVKVISPVPYAPLPLSFISSKWKKYRHIEKHRQLEGIEVYYPRYLEFPRGFLFHLSGFFMSLGIKKIIKKIHEDFKFDIIHANVAVPDGYAALVIGDDYRAHTVVTVHGQDFQNTLFKNESCIKALDKTLNKADKIITVSSKLKNMVKDKSYYDKISVVYNGIDVEETDAEKSIDGDKINILSVSNLRKTKGIDYNIKAMANLTKVYKNLHYYIIGSGPEEVYLKNLTENLNLTEYISFLGKKEHEEVIKWVKGCDIFSLPSFVEGFGVAYLEAMSEGKPVIGVKGEGIEDIIVNGENGFLIDREDVNSLEKALSFLIESPDARKSIGEKANLLVTRDLTWDKNAKEMLKIYINLNR